MTRWLVGESSDNSDINVAWHCLSVVTMVMLSDWDDASVPWSLLGRIPRDSVLQGRGETYRNWQLVLGAYPCVPAFLPSDTQLLWIHLLICFALL
jgi:hypothetical protein